MASPAVESVCCFLNDTISRGGDTNVPGLSFGIYNTLCMTSASISIGGAFYQLLPRKPTNAPRTTRELESWQRQNTIICWLALADLFASVGVLIRSAVWTAGYVPWKHLDDGRLQYADLFCAISTGWIQYFYISTYIWTFCYAVDVYRLVHDLQPKIIIYHISGWILSLLFCLSGLLVIYTPAISSCRVSKLRWPAQFLTVHAPILLVMIISPVLLYKASRKVEGTLRSRGLYTDTERSVIRNLKKKFFLVILVFYICWFPNIINGIFLLKKHAINKGIIYALWNYMALVNPMQAFLNSLVYRGLGGCQLCPSTSDENLIPRLRQKQRTRTHVQSTTSTEIEQSSETAPLLSFRL